MTMPDQNPKRIAALGELRTERVVSPTPQDRFSLGDAIRPVVRHIVPVAVVFATLVARRLCPDSIYTLKLRRRGIVLRHGRDINVLSGTRVKDIMVSTMDIIPENARLPEILKVISKSEAISFPGVDAKGDLVGTLGMQDVRQLLSGPMPGELIIARDLAHTDTPRLCEDESLEVALSKFAPQGLEAVPVVDASAQHRLVGMLKRDAVTSFYNRRLLERIEE